MLSLLQDTEWCKEVLHEIQIICWFARIKGNIFTCEVHDIITEKDCFDFFIVSEVIHASIDQILLNSAKLKLSESHVVEILYSLLCSLNFVHSSNLMLRNIHPSNLLVTDRGYVKIFEFKGARSVPENLVTPKLGEDITNFSRNQMPCLSFYKDHSKSSV